MHFQLNMCSLKYRREAHGFNLNLFEMPKVLVINYIGQINYIE